MRNPQVAGTFYPSDPETLRTQIREFFSKTPKQERKASFAIAPHAGYTFSGQTAAFTYSALEKADTYIIVGPNHHGMGMPVSVSMQDIWATPLGPVELDRELAAQICRQSRAEPGEDAHELEHSIEVQLPFLQERFTKFKIVPISILPFGNTEEMLSLYSEIGHAIAKAVKESGKKVAVIASSDFSHFIPKEKAEQLDKIAIKKIESLSAKEFLETTVTQDMSICGFAPITIAMLAAKELGATKGKLLHYTTSAETTGDTSQVVAYASMILV